MSEMVERVAAAIQARMPGTSNSDINVVGLYSAMARSAIEAMRNPTEAMEIAGQVDPFPISTKPAWCAMIDEALK